ncbi:hypothetical protein EDB87DRAFT_1640345 [Lactarius vividus]|nr:hypothetical protein EDB87DRAFT_1640345 [Lactarius vividus]
MYEGRQIEAGFVFADFTFTTTYTFLFVDDGVVSQVGVACIFLISCRSVQRTNCPIMGI